MKFVRIGLCAGAALMLSATLASAAPAFVLSNVNLRSGPATTDAVVVLIPAGATVEATDCKDGWCSVTWQNKSGFAIQTALDMSGRPHPVYAGPAAAAPPPGYAVAAPVYAAPPPVVYYGPAYPYGWGWHRHW